MNPREQIVQAILDSGARCCYIKFAGMFEHDDCEPDVDSPSCVSLSLFIAGGDDIEIAKTIYNWKPLGIALNGDFSLTVEGVNISWYNLNYSDYKLQQQSNKKANNKLERQYLLQRLAELEGEED